MSLVQRRLLFYSTDSFWPYADHQKIVYNNDTNIPRKGPDAVELEAYVNVKLRRCPGQPCVGYVPQELVRSL